MNDDATVDVASRRYQHPEPMYDLEAWSENNWEWFDPNHAHSLLWPDRAYKPDLDILIAGSDCNQAAIFAFTNRAAKVVAIDVSQPALEHLEILKDKYALSNLELHRLPIEEVSALRLDFDLIVSTGALHLLADPVAGMRALSGCLRRNGAMGVALPAKQGRMGIGMLQEAFRDLDMSEDDTPVQVVREVISALPTEHPVHNYFKIAPVSEQSDAALAATFLRGPERTYSVDECLDLVASTGLVFQGWFLKAPYRPHDWFLPGSALDQAMHALPETKLWSVVERLHVLNASHFFMACRTDRSKETYVIDFSMDKCMDYAPKMRMRSGIEGHEIYRPNWRTGLTSPQLLFLHFVNGRRTIRQIAESVAKSGESLQVSNLEEFGRRLFESLWHLDFTAMTLKEKSAKKA